MAYERTDFTESLDRVKIDVSAIEHVLAAWGDSPSGYGSWEGGFLMRMRDGRFAYLTGWCDTSGWGCRDGADVYYYDAGSDLDRAQLPAAYGVDAKVGVAEWDEEPADLNRALVGAT